MAKISKKSADAYLSVAIRGNDVEIEPVWKKDTEEAMVVLLLSIVNGELYAAILQRFQDMKDKNQLDMESFNKMIGMLNQALQVMKNQEEEDVIRPSQVFNI